MRRVPVYAVAIAAGAAFTTASAQFSAVKPNPAKTAVSTATGISGGFLMGVDNCVGAHTVVAAGPQAGVPFTTGTTGTQGQNEANCYAFGSTQVHNDVWFDWQATATGNASMITCAGTTVDTKIAAYPLNAGACPADGTSLACNDDACGLQSSITWSVVAGTSYTLQLGTFPGAAGGSGTFNTTQQAPPPCGQYDDGTTENSLGLIAGGETGWLHFQDCLQTVDSIDTAYGTPLGSGVPNGAASNIVAYEDSDCDANPTTPAAGMTVMWSVATVTSNVDTDILNNVPRVGGTASAPSRCTWVMGTAVQAAGTFPGPMDQTNPTPNAWVAGQTLGAGGVMNLTNLNANNVPPLQMQAIGFAAAWLLRANGTESSGNPFPAQCFGAACPCGNNSTNGGGCDNSIGGLNGNGAILAGSGSASLANDTLVLTATVTTNQPGIFFQGNLFLGPPPVFGDGLRCCGQNVVRCGTYLPAGNTTNTSTGNLIGGNAPPISNIGPNTNLNPGDIRCYQWWYRDPNNGPCGSGFNLSNSISVTWGA
jgi:hypothetical protein